MPSLEQMVDSDIFETYKISFIDDLMCFFPKKIVIT